MCFFAVTLLLLENACKISRNNHFVLESVMMLFLQRRFYLYEKVIDFYDSNLRNGVLKAKGF